MPSETDKILEAYRKTTVPINEATPGSTYGGVAAGAATGAALGTLAGPVGTVVGGVIGGGVGLAGNIGAGATNRVALAAQKFLAGRGGGISQLVGKGLSLTGKHHKRLQAQHTQQDTSNWLFMEIQGLLQRHDGSLTIRQVKDFLAQKKISKKSNSNIDPDKLPSISSLPDEQTLDEEQIKTLFQSLASELMDVAQTGTKAEANIEELVKAINNLPPAQAAELLIAYQNHGLIPLTL